MSAHLITLKAAGVLATTEEETGQNEQEFR